MSEDQMTGNKGEWSEPYVLLKALGDGRIYGADGDTQRKSDVFFDVNRVFRHDGGSNLVFIRVSEEELVRVLKDGREYTSIVIPSIVMQYRRMFASICEGKNAFPIPESERFLRQMGCTTLKAPSNDKTDITIEIHEPKTGMDLIQGFSIKSMLGNPSTLINSSGATNVIFSLDGVTEKIAERANEIRNGSSKTKIIDMIQYLKSQGVGFTFLRTDDRTLNDNLTLVDSAMPKLLGEMLKLYYVERVSGILEQITELEKTDPLNFGNPMQVPYYRYKVKKLLVSYALGMQSATPWSGIEDANGGYIIVKKDGDVLCYHIFDRGSFEDYLIKNTRFDTPPTHRHKYAVVYEESGRYLLKLNMQIRFMSSNDRIYAERAKGASKLTEFCTPERQKSS